MAAKIVFLGLLSLVAIQGTLSMSQRNILDDIKSKLDNVGEEVKKTADKVADAVKEAAAAVEEKAKAAYQDAVDKVQDAVDKAKDAAQEALDKIKSVFQGVKDKAKEVVDKVKGDLADIKQKAEDRISAIVDKLKQGEGALVCAAKSRDKIESVLGESGRNVSACTSAVAQEAVPIIADATETVDKLKDLRTRVKSVMDKCIPLSGNIVLAVPCFALSTAAVLSDVAKDIVTIKDDVSDIIDKAPGLKEEIQSCAAQVKLAKENVDDLVDEITDCANNYVSSAAA